MRSLIVKAAVGIVLAVLVFAEASAAVEEFTIDYDRNVDLLPLNLVAKDVTDFRGRVATVCHGAQVLYVEGRDSSRAIVVHAFNGEAGADQPAVVSYDDFTTDLVIDHDPLPLVLRSICLYSDCEAETRAVAAGCWRNDSAFVARLIPGTDRYDLLFLCHGGDATGDGRWWARVEPVYVGDYDFDGCEEGFFYLDPGRDLVPRILYCIDLSSLTLEWSLPIAGPIGTRDVYASEDSTDPALCFVTYNYKNGVSDDNFDDYFCYLVKLDTAGHILHRSIVSEEHGVRGLWPGRAHGEFFLFHSLPQVPRSDAAELPQSRYQLSKLDSECRPLLTVDVDARLMQGWLMDRDNDGLPEFHALTGSGRVLVFDDSLRLVARSNETNLKYYQGRLKLAGYDQSCLVFQSGRGMDIYSPGWQLLGSLPRDFLEFHPLAVDREGAVTKLLVSASNRSMSVAVERRELIDYVRLLFWQWQDAIVAALVLLLLALVLINARRRMADRRVAARERMLRAVIANLQDGFYRTDLDGTIIWGSPSAAHMLGYTREELLGRRTDDLQAYPPRREELKELLRRDGAVKNWETQLQCKDGRIITVSVNAAFYRNDRGEIAGIEGIFRDVTELKEASAALESERDFIRSLLETANSLILGLDRDANVVVFNDELAAVTGYTQEEVLGRYWHDLCVPADECPEARADFSAHVKASPRDRYEGLLLTRSGEVRTILWSTSALFDNEGELSVAIAVGQDITERKKAEEASRAAHVEMTQIFHAAAPMCVIDTDFNIIRVNDTYTEVFELERGEEVGRKCFEKWPGPLCHTERCPLRQILDGREHYEYEIDNTLESGKIVTTVVKAEPFRDADGNILGIVESYADISARKHAETALKASERFSRAVIEQSPLGISVRAPDGTLLSVNDAWKVIWGRSEENVREEMERRRTELRFDHRDDYLGDWQPEVRRIYEEGGYLHISEVPRQRHSGIDGWVSQHFYAIQNDRGEVDRVVIMTEDITERKRTQMALSASEQAARAMLNAVSETKILLKADFTVATANETAARRLGISLDALLGAHIDEVMPHVLGKDVFRARWERAKEALSAGEPVRFVDQRAGRWYDQTHYPVLGENGEVVHIALFAQDITERRNAEVALRQSEEKYRLVVENVMAGIGLVERDGRTAFVNRTVAALYGRSQEEMVGTTLWELFDRDTADRLIAAITRTVTGADIQHELLDFDLPDRRHIVSMYLHPFPDASGTVIGALLIGHDLTDTKMAEQARRESEETARAIVNAATETIFLLDTDERILAANETAAERIGCSIDDLVGMSLEEMIPDLMDRDLAESRRRKFVEVMRTGKPVRFEDSREGHWYYTTMYPVLDEAGRVVRVALFSTDMTDRKLAEKEREDAARERYEQVRRIAGGVAHEIYNALFPATSSLDLLRGRLTQTAPPDDGRNQRLIELSEGAVRRALAMTELVTEYSRLEAQRRSDTVELAGLIAEMLRANQERIERLQVTVGVDIQGGLQVTGSRIHLYSLFNNLLLNALDAVAEVARRKVNIEAWIEGDRVRATVTDSGPGIAEEHLPHVFKAFFSTKPTAGTGLGLAMVQKIAQMYGGEVALESTIDKGTRFTIFLASAAPAPDPG